MILHTKATSCLLLFENMDPSLSYARESVLQSERLSSELHIKYIDSSMDSIRQWVYIFLSLGTIKDPETFPDPHHFDADPDPACHFDADPDPSFHCDSDSDSQSDADPAPQDCLWNPIYRSCFLFVDNVRI
jgi:hypothetical protein